jgi:hypothetical protein
MIEYTIMTRKRILVNTDPQRRCYNGCHFSSELVWTAWTALSTSISRERAESQLKFWKELNDYAVSQRGKSAIAEFKIVEKEFVQ